MIRGWIEQLAKSSYGGKGIYNGVRERRDTILALWLILDRFEHLVEHMPKALEKQLSADYS